MYDIVVVGGGPAGLAATVYAARKQLRTLLISRDVGGQINLTLGIENYLGYQFVEGPELIQKFQEQVAQFPIDQKIGPSVTSIKKVKNGFTVRTDEGKVYPSRSVLYTAGKRPRTLNVPGERAFTGRGVSYCAICDGPVFAGQKVVIVGGGNSALEAALDMLKIAEHVDLVSLTPLTGDDVLIKKLPAKSQKLSLYLEHETLAISGDVLADGIEIRDTATGEVKRLAVTGVFIEIGMVPNSGLLKELTRLNELGEVIVSKSGETGVPGLFAAGDVTDVPEKQIVVSAGEGAKAALTAHRYLQRLA